jgi:hypothetical protein
MRILSEIKDNVWDCKNTKQGKDQVFFASRIVEVNKKEDQSEDDLNCGENDWFDLHCDKKIYEIKR